MSARTKKDTRASSQITHAALPALCVRARCEGCGAHAARYRAEPRGWRLAAQTQTNPTKNAQKEIAPTGQGLEEFVRPEIWQLHKRRRRVFLHFALIESETFVPCRVYNMRV